VEEMSRARENVTTLFQLNRFTGSNWKWGEMSSVKAGSGIS
jgi:hypothetical protein